MEINWFEIIFQIINFFTLIFILQKLLYKPVTNIMEKRKQNLENMQKQSEDNLNRANILMAEYNEKMENILKTKEKILKEAAVEAENNKNELIETYKKQALQKKEEFDQLVEKEKEEFLSNVRSTLTRGSIKISKEIFKLISDSDIDEKTFEAFLKLLDELDTIHIKKNLNQSRKISLRSSSELSAIQKELFLKKFLEKFGDAEISFVVNKELIYGYELNLQSISISKNVKKYLEDVEQEMMEVISC